MNRSAWDRADEAAVQAIAARHGEADSPIVVGLAGAQGSGKSTMARRLVARLAEQGLRCAPLSLDDFYLPRQERLELGCAVHPLLVTRGVPGTHDVSLLAAALDALLAGEPVASPRFNKAVDDRMQDARERLVPPFDVILLEGWCVGARPQPAEQLAAPINALEGEEDPSGLWRRWINARLAGDYAALFDRLALRIFLRAPNFEVVARWRGEQEAEIGASGMSGAELARFVAHYERITRWMLSDEPADLVIELDPARVPRTPRVGTPSNVALRAERSFNT